MPLFKIDHTHRAAQVRKMVLPKEKDIHVLCERNLEAFFNIRVVASEFPTGQKHAGRIDTLGLDGDDSPVIIEYKKTEHENIINQGLFYMDWLTDHRGDFELVARKRLGQEIKVSWERPRLLLIAESFGKYDLYAINKIGQAIELVTYRMYEDGLLYFETLNEVPDTKTRGELSRPGRSGACSLNDLLKDKPELIQKLFKVLQSNILGFGTQIEEKILKLYVAYQTSRNFCEVIIQAKQLTVHLDLPLKELKDPKRICEDVSHKGHWATGHTRIAVKSLIEAEYTLDLIRQSYNATL